MSRTWQGQDVSFLSAKPIWPAGREKERNLFAGFRAEFTAAPSGRAVLRVTASTIYRAWLNGVFVGHGPARAAHDFYRVDEWVLDGALRPGRNIVALEVAGYNANGYAYLDQPSFVQAEVTAEGRTLASTAGAGAAFAAFILEERVQKVARYSFQRLFTEYYRLRTDLRPWRLGEDATRGPVACAEQPDKALLPRRVPYPAFGLRQPVEWTGGGRMQAVAPAATLWKDRSLVNVGEKFGGYRLEELAVCPSLEFQSLASCPAGAPPRPYRPQEKVRLAKDAYGILDLGANLTGFIGARVSCTERTRLFFSFDEILSPEGDVNWRRMGCVNLIGYALEPGTYDLESFEPYTFRYLKLIVLEGAAEFEGVFLREFSHAGVWAAHFAAADPRLARLFAAARETFAQNALDIFMDCPSRERAGWLCDSFFTARAERDLTGRMDVETNFLENYLLPEKFAHHPDGMLPMCYPSDHYDGVFIPNWALWFVVQLEEYRARGGDVRLCAGLEPKVAALLAYLRGFENSDGLLEKLPSWVFVEWSAANQFVQDVNYPSNMLYAGALSAAGRLYARPEWLARGEQVRERVRAQSFDGQFFVDHAVRKDGRLEVLRDRSEACQYYAFFFRVATPETHPDLWRVLTTQFGPHRQEQGLFPEVHPANAFIGNVLRLEILSRAGLCRQLLEETVAYQLHMAERTGTLWEHQGAQASCNHGFASHTAHLLCRDVLGVHELDPVARRVRLRFCETDLPWCEGRLVVPDGAVALRWWQEPGRFCYTADVPAGYVVEVENLTGREVVRR